jgi:hypothetical protein
MNRQVDILTAINIALVSLILALYLSDPEPSVITIILIVLYAVSLACWLLSLYLNLRRLRKTLALLNEQCDPDAYLLKTRKLLDRAIRWGTTDDVLLWRLNVAAGLIAAGRYHEALYTLPDHRLFRDNRRGKLQQAICHHNGFAVFLGLGMTDAARQALTMMHGAAGGLKPGKAQARLSHLYRLYYARYTMAQGDFDGAEAVFREAIDKAESNYARVSTTLELGRVYAHFGRTDEARQAFEYVISHGNKLYAVAQAREELAALGA